MNTDGERPMGDGGGPSARLPPVIIFAEAAVALVERQFHHQDSFSFKTMITTLSK